MAAPLTRAATGRTICPGCNRRFANTPDAPVTETEAEIENRGRIDSIGQLHRGHRTHTVTRRWHTACLESFEASNEAYRAQVEQDRLDMLRTICDAAGLDYEEQLAKHRP